MSEETRRASQGARPADVDTGFWLWLVAVPLMVSGYLVDLVTSERPHPPAVVYVFSGMFVFVIAAVVVTFLFLMRQGYRWARTVLTGGGVASMVYAGTSLFTVDRPTTAAAVLYAVSAIVGSVLIAGGVFLLHRKDAHAFFVR